MKTIHKYELGTDTTIDTFDGVIFLSLQMQGEKVCLWAEVETDNINIIKRIICFGTGHKIPDSIGDYIGTVQIEQSLVFHFFEAY